MINIFLFNKKRRSSFQPLISGFTLVETLVAISIFAIVSVGILSGFVSILKVMRVTRAKAIMTNIANEQFEIIRNLTYQSVGTTGGIPSGVISQSQTISKDNKTFTIGTVVRNYDDPFDGTFNGTPKDLSPADMKMVELTITCISCEDTLSPISFTTKVAPKNLETAAVDGALVIKVFDASGLPVEGANVNIVNNSISPVVNLNDMTDIYGILTLVDAPPSVSGYQITVSKEGYSTERTYPVGGGGNPHPTKPNITVVAQQISQISFTIDETSTINVSSVNNQCVVSPNFDFTISGSKIIGTNPTTIKYSNTTATNGTGSVSLPNIEWDTYNIVGADSTLDIIGTNPLLSLGVNPNVNQNMQIITAPKNGNRLVVVVRDQATGLPVSDVTVKLTGPSSYSNTVVTNEGFQTQTDWSGGSGQSDYVYANRYFSSDGNINDSTSPGNLSLKKTGSVYSSNGDLTSSTFDTGSSSNFRQITWAPVTQPAQTGTSSVRFQIATNDDNTTWNFLGPDGTSSSYYTSSNQNINAVHNGDQYLRYRLFLSTLNTAYTPTISDISFTYTSSCVPPGQVSFSSLSSGTYTIAISKTGYQSTTRTTSISSSWKKEEFTISQ